jgi:hypothetical protein
VNDQDIFCNVDGELGLDIVLGLGVVITGCDVVVIFEFIPFG